MNVFYKKIMLNFFFFKFKIDKHFEKQNLQIIKKLFLYF